MNPGLSVCCCSDTSGEVGALPLQPRPHRDSMNLYCMYDSLMMPRISMTSPHPPNIHTHTVFTTGRCLQVACCSRMYVYEVLFSSEVRSLPTRNEGCSSKSVESSYFMILSCTLRVNCTFSGFRHVRLAKDIMFNTNIL